MRLLALDVGERRVGVAISDEMGLIVTPLTTIRRASKAEDFARIAGLIREQQAQGVVIGHPLNRDGSAGPQARRVEKYAHALESALHDDGLDPVVVLWDEYLSTWQAEEVLAGAGPRSKARRAGLDAAAAAIILREYLEAKPH
jgi:putative pre-16S rRNA nuclease